MIVHTGACFQFKLRTDEYSAWQPLFDRKPASLNWTELNSNKVSKKQRRTK